MLYRILDFKFGILELKIKNERVASEFNARINLKSNN